MTPLPTTLCIFLRQWNLLPFLNSWVHVNISQLLFFLKLKTKTKTEKEKVGCLLTFSFLNLPRWELYSTVSFTTRPSFLQLLSGLPRPTGAGMKLEEDTTGQQRMGLTSWARLEPCRRRKAWAPPRPASLAELNTVTGVSGLPGSTRPSHQSAGRAPTPKSVLTNHGVGWLTDAFTRERAGTLETSRSVVVVG